MLDEYPESRLAARYASSVSAHIKSGKSETRGQASADTGFQATSSPPFPDDIILVIHTAKSSSSWKCTGL